MHLERREKNGVLIFTIVVVAICNGNWCFHDGLILQFVVLPAVAGLILARENSRVLGSKLKIGMRFH